MKYRQTFLSGGLILVAILFSVFWKGDFPWAKSQPAQREKNQTQFAPERSPSKKANPKVRDSTPKEIGSAIYVKGPKGARTDIGPTLNRILKKKRFPHRNDGSVFQNREKRLPLQARRYYHEYVHPTPNMKGPGPQRIVIGTQNEVYYTPDHYRHFQRVKLDTKIAFPITRNK